MTPSPLWIVPQADLPRRLDSSLAGLTAAVAERRLAELGPNRIHDRPRSRTALLLVRQFTSPIVLLLIGAALSSWLVYDSTDARVILGIVVIVKRLAAIENFGSMDVSCSDKTGTLTEGRVRLRSAVDAAGHESQRVLLHAYLNSTYQTGLLVLHDPIKRDVEAAVRALNGLGVSVKVITGDNALVARQVTVGIGMRSPMVLTARELATTSDDALPVRAANTDVFAEIEPNQKEHIIRALHAQGTWSDTWGTA
jgi:magnesium-transporting ATPase (P-type)